MPQGFLYFWGVDISEKSAFLEDVLGMSTGEGRDPPKIQFYRNPDLPKNKNPRRTERKISEINIFICFNH